MSFHCWCVVFLSSILMIIKTLKLYCTLVIRGIRNPLTTLVVTIHMVMLCTLVDIKINLSPHFRFSMLLVASVTLGISACVL